MDSGLLLNHDDNFSTLSYANHDQNFEILETLQDQLRNVPSSKFH